MPSSLPALGLDLAALGHQFRAAGFSLSHFVADLIGRLDRHSDAAVWIYRLPAEALEAQAAAVDKRLRDGATLPLYGIPFAVKDNIDVSGQPTTAGCPGFRYVARGTAPVVARLLEAGALLVGKTNMDQFATGLAGDRSPYGVCRNPFDATRIPGGSSSGSAVAVAEGLVSFALGTDTAGSGRVPAACNNVVGWKATPGSLSTEGVVSACRSLDCLSIFALTAEDARRVWDVARANPDAGDGGAAWAACRGDEFTFAVPRDEDLDFFGDDDQAQLFREAVHGLRRLGGRCVPVDWTPFRAVGRLLYEGPWVAERLAGLEDFLRAHRDEILSVTRSILESGAVYRGVDVFRGLAELAALRQRCLPLFDTAEMLVVPTMPTLPTLAEVRADSRLWGSRLGTYTNFVNLLGLAALAVPAGFTPRGLPGGITLVGPAGSEHRLGELGTVWQRQRNLPLGATGQPMPPPVLPPRRPEAAPAGWVRVAVAGAHLRGQPLHPALLRCGARFVDAARTAPRYRFVALMDLEPPRPGLVRDEACTGSAQVELYDLPPAGFGALVASVDPPLSIGTVELSDGHSVKGFLCESYAAAQARDITRFGSWVAFRQHLARSGSPDGGRTSRCFDRGPNA